MTMVTNSVFILHIATIKPMHYALCIMHHAPHVPASHGGSDANAMQDENYASLRYAL